MLTEKIVLAKSLFNMCKSFIYIKHGSVFFHRHTCLHLSHFFCCIIRKYLSHKLFCTQFVSVCYTMKLYFLLQNTLDIPGMGHFFLSSHLSRFFCSIIRKYLSHVLFWSQLVSVCFAMKFFFSFKIHCLQMFQLFQTKDGPIFFIVTLVYTCRTFFLLYHQKIFVPCIVLVTARLSLFRNEILLLL